MEDKQILCLSQNSSFLVPENDTAALIGNKPDHRIWGHRRMRPEASGLLVCAQALRGLGSWGGFQVSKSASAHLYCAAEPMSQDLVKRQILIQWSKERLETWHF